MNWEAIGSIAELLGAAGVIASLLFGIDPGDPASFGLGAVFVLAIGASAGFAPTLRAVRIDPAGTLRED